MSAPQNDKNMPGGIGWGAPPSVPPAGYAQPGYPVQPAYPVQPGMAPQAAYPTQPAYPQAGYPQTGYPQPGYPQAPPVYNQLPGYTPSPGYGQMAYNVTSGNEDPYQTGNQDANPKPEEGPDNFGSSFSDKAIRAAFVRKVYLILMAQLLMTLAIVSLFTFHTPTKVFVHQNPWVYFVSYGTFLVTYITLVCCSGVRRKWPGNFIMLTVFTLALSYMTGAIASHYDTKIVVMTVGITAVICFLITLFATQTKYDFTGCGIYLFVAGMVLFIFGIIAIFTYSEIMSTIYSAGIALLFSMYLVYDTQMLFGGRKHNLSPEEHIFGALCLYLDVINIFLALLSLSRN